MKLEPGGLRQHIQDARPDLDQAAITWILEDGCALELDDDIVLMLYERHATLTHGTKTKSIALVYRRDQNAAASAATFWMNHVGPIA